MASRSLGTLTVDLVAKTGGFEAGMDKAARTADRRMKEIERRAYQFGRAIGTSLKVAAGVATVAIGAISVAVKQAIDDADGLRDLSIQIGASTELLSGYAYAAKQTGTDIDELGKGLLRLSRNASAALDPKSRQASLFEALLGPDYKSQIRDIETLVPAIADKFAILDESVQKTALAQELFGRSGASLMEFLNSGGDGLDEFSQKAADLGVVISQDTADAADEFNDVLGDVKTLVSGLGLQIAQALLPSLITAAEDFRDLVKEGDLASNMVDVLSGLMSTGVGIIKGYNNAVAGLSIQFEFLAKAAKGFKEINDNIGIGGLFKDGSIAGGFETIKQAGEEADAQWRAVQKSVKETVKAANDSEFLYKPAPADPAKKKEGQTLEDRLAGFFTNPTGSTGSSKGGKSDAEREAESLQKAYDSLMESMEERIALFNTEGEAAKVAYDLEFGSLSALTDAQKANALALAEQYDQMVKLREEGEARAKMAEEETNRINEGLDAGKALLDDLRFELELMRMTNEERVTAIQLRGLEAEAVAEYGEQIAQANRDIAESMKQVELMDGFRDSFAGFFEDVLSGTKSVKDAFTDMLDNINRMILQRIADNWVEKLFGAYGSSGTGSTGGGWMDIFAGLFSGGKAGGGWAAANSIYEVNERGMEMASVNGRDYLLTGNKPVEITPNNRLQTAGGGVTQNFYSPRFDTKQTPAQLAQEARIAQQLAMRNA